MQTPANAFQTAAPLYRAKGFWPIPVKPNEKWPPPTGVTGFDGVVTDAKVERWMEDDADSNLALRAFGFIGIDVDHYGDKTGADTLAEFQRIVGRRLPATWSSSSRGPGPSRIYIFKVPEDAILDGKIGNDIEIIQRSHRYGMVWPSVHPNGGQYRWYRPDGSLADEGEIPDLDFDIPELPAEHLEYLTRAPQGAMLTDVDVVPWRGLAETFTPAGDQDECIQVTVLRQRVEDAREADGHVGHDAILRLASNAFLMGREGHRGIPEVLDELFQGFKSYLVDTPGRDPREADSAFTSAAEFAQRRVIENVCRCDDSIITDDDVDPDDAVLAFLLQAPLLSQPGPRGQLNLRAANAQFTRQTPVRRLAESTGATFIYSDGRWRVDDVEPYVFRFLEDNLTADEYSHKKLDDLTRYVLLRAQRVTEQDFDTRFVSVANGLLDWETGELKPRTPDVFAINTLPISWNPDARPGRIAEWIDLTFTAEQQSHVWEIMGYAISPTHDLKVALALTGPGGGGKSTFINLLTALVGTENTVAMPPNLMSQGAHLAFLHGKTLNAAGDVGTEVLKNLGDFKAIIAGDQVTANPKYKAPFRYRPRAFHVASFNVLPEVEHNDSAFWDRWLVLEHNRRFNRTGISDNYFRDKMPYDRKALEGALVYAIRGLQRLRERGGFDQDVFGSAKDKWRAEVDDVAGFLATHVQVSPLGEVKGDGLYTLYQAVCAADGRHPKTKQEFNKGILAHAQERGWSVEKRSSPSRVVSWLGLQAIVAVEHPDSVAQFGKRGFIGRVA